MSYLGRFGQKTSGHQSKITTFKCCLLANDLFQNFLDGNSIFDGFGPLA